MTHKRPRDGLTARGAACEQATEYADEPGQDRRKDPLDGVGRHFVDIGNDDAHDAGDETDAEQVQNADGDRASGTIANEPSVQVPQLEVAVVLAHDQLGLVQGRTTSAREPSARSMSILPPLLLTSR